MNLSKPPPRPGTSFRLSRETKDLLARLAGHLGISRRSVIDAALRTYARQEGLLPPSPYPVRRDVDQEHAEEQHGSQV
jgi:hypothetical protein